MSAGFLHYLVLQDSAMLHVFKVDISSDFPPAFAGPGHKRMLLRARYRAAAAIRHTILIFEPLRRGRIHRGEIDLVAMLPTELLE